MFYVEGGQLQCQTRDWHLTSPDSGQTWGNTGATVYPSMAQRISVQSLPDGRTAAWISEDTTGLRLRNKGAIWISSNLVVQAKIPINSETNPYSFVYPMGLVHDGLVDTLWADAHDGSGGWSIYFNEQPLDQLLGEAPAGTNGVGLVAPVPEAQYQLSVQLMSNKDVRLSCIGIAGTNYALDRSFSSVARGLGAAGDQFQREQVVCWCSPFHLSPPPTISGASIPCRSHPE